MQCFPSDDETACRFRFHRCNYVMSIIGLIDQDCLVLNEGGRRIGGWEHRYSYSGRHNRQFNEFSMNRGLPTKKLEDRPKWIGVFQKFLQR